MSIAGPSEHRIPDDAEFAMAALQLFDVARRTVVNGSCVWLDDHLAPDATAGRQLWITARTAHVLSVGGLLHVPDTADLADVALASIDTDFGDSAYGGWFAARDEGGRPALCKNAYEHAFVLLAAASGVLAGRAGTSSLLRRAITVVNEHFWDEDSGTMRESWDQSWTLCEDYRGANANMHAVEAFIAVADATGNDLWIRRAHRIARRIVDVAAAHDWRLPEHFDASWAPLLDYNIDEPNHKFRPPGVTPGHAAEWARLLVQLWTRDSSAQWALVAAQQFFERAMDDGWNDVDGGVVYTTSLDGTPLVTARFHWVQCESVLAADFLARATGLAQFSEWRDRLWAYIWPRFPDRVFGGWHHELTAAGSPASTTWHGKPDTYHAIQACLAPRLDPARSVAGSFARL